MLLLLIQMHSFLEDSELSKKKYSSMHYSSFITSIMILLPKYSSKIIPQWIHPNHLTLIGQLLGIIAIALQISYKSDSIYNYPSEISIIVGVLGILSWWCDEVDGYWAVKTNRTSLLGEIYDHSLDFIIDILYGFYTLYYLADERIVLIIVILASKMIIFLFLCNQRINGVFALHPHLILDNLFICCIWLIFGLFGDKININMVTGVYIIFKIYCGYLTNAMVLFINVIRTQLIIDVIFILSIHIFWIVMYLLDTLPQSMSLWYLVMHITIATAQYELIFLVFKMCVIEGCLFYNISEVYLIILFSIVFIIPLFIPLNVVMVTNMVFFVYNLYHVRRILIKKESLKV